MMLLIKRLARYLQYMDRSKRYVSTLQFILIVLMYLDMRIDFSNWLFYFLMCAIVLSMLIIGFIDKRLKIYEEEQRYISENNPVIQEIKELIKKGGN